tara:strand:+ start:941 stop:1285 length:345 start_codon:yes stop_codon:yes gene_type:complete
MTTNYPKVPNIISAIKELKPGNHWTVYDENYDSLEWDSDNPDAKPTKAEIEAKIDELQIAYDAAKYQRDRVDFKNTIRYPELKEQLDMIYHDQVNGTTTFKDAIKAVKDKYPKP